MLDISTFKTRDQLYFQYTFLRDEILNTYPKLKERCTEPGAILFGSFIGLLRKFDHFFTKTFVLETIPDEELSYVKNSLDSVLEALGNIEAAGEVSHPEPGISLIVRFFKYLCYTATRSSTTDMVWQSLKKDFSELYSCFHTCAPVSQVTYKTLGNTNENLFYLMNQIAKYVRDMTLEYKCVKIASRCLRIHDARSLGYYMHNGNAWKLFDISYQLIAKAGIVHPSEELFVDMFLIAACMDVMQLSNMWFASDLGFAVNHVHEPEKDLDDEFWPA